MPPLDLTTPTPNSACIVRSFAATPDRVWRAFTDASIVKQWMTGPPGHSLPVCEIDLRVGGKARYVWKNPEFEMGMTAEFREIVEHERIVQSEAFEDWPEGASVVTTTFEASPPGTTVRIKIVYGAPAARDAVVESGFAEGYEASFVNLDEMLDQQRDTN